MNIKGSTLKWIAIISMLIDHIGAFIFEPILVMNNIPLSFNIPENYKYSFLIYITCRLIGRIAFPIFSFLLVQGFIHTKNIKKYALNLLLFALISEIPFDLANKGILFSFEMQNVYFTLLIGLVAIYLLEYFAKDNILYKLLIMLVSGGIAYFLKTDYSFFGVIVIIVLYLYKDNKKLQALNGILIFSWEITAPLAFLFIWFYNGERGSQNKYFFYLFYPLHLLILYYFRIFLLG